MRTRSSMSVSALLLVLALAVLLQNTGYCASPRSPVVPEVLTDAVKNALPAKKTPTLVMPKLEPESFSLWTPRANWWSNRCADLRDIFSFGVGATIENRVTGPLPPTLGAYGEFTGLLHLGAITHNGATAEWDGRGMGVYSELRRMLALGPWQRWSIRQGDYKPWSNLYKDDERSAKWAARMAGQMRFELADAAAKSLIYKDEYRQDVNKGVLRRRGWQRFMYTGGELGICDPFLTHWGFTVRAGVDVSEVFDFLMGWFGVDFQEDDRRQDE